MAEFDDDTPAGWRLSRSASRARDAFPEAEPIAAAALVTAILDQGHRSEYAGGRAAEWDLEAVGPADARRTATAWIAAVQTLFDPTSVSDTPSPTSSAADSAWEGVESAAANPILDGRLLIVGLGILDPPLRGRLRRAGVLAALEAELPVPVETLLTARGRALRRPDDQVPPQSDTPLQTADQDRLNRAAFASYLAERIAFTRLSTERAFSILLYGPWGSGKSTLFNFLSEDLHRRRKLVLAPPVARARDRFERDEPITLDELGRAILEASGVDPSDAPGNERRDGGAGADGGDGSLPETAGDGDRYPARRWFQEVWTLFDDDAVRTLDARTALVGLGLLDPTRYAQIRVDGRPAPPVDELRGRLDPLLTERGRLRHESWAATRAPTTGDGADPLAEEPESAPSVEAGDEPPGGGNSEAPESAVDGESPADAGRDESASGDDRRAPLPPDERAWKVVRFNAWQHQHVRPPWWALLDRLFHESESDLSPADRLSEYWWRLGSRRLVFLVGVTVIVWLVVLVALPRFVGGQAAGTSALGRIAGVAGDFGTVIALLVTIWAGVEVVSKPVFLDSAHAARSYVDFSREPMHTIQRRFNALVDRIPRHVLVFVDDLDRCQSEYVVELLEGIQTLFGDAPVTFVVAADRRWLDACFEEVYATHTTAIRQPGKVLGTLFAEKAFQLAAPVPGVPSSLHERYWQHLIRVSPPDPPDDDATDSPPARDGSEERGTPTQEDREALRHTRRNVRRLALPETQDRTEHLLSDFTPLLDRNPRAMKRLVNAYSTNRALATLTGIDVDRETLALWTILTLRWPALAAHLEAHPADVAAIDGDGDVERAAPAAVAADLRPLFVDPAVDAVVSGAGTAAGAALEPADVRTCTHLRS